MRRPADPRWRYGRARWWPTSCAASWYPAGLADHGRRPRRRAPLPAGLPVRAVRRLPHEQVVSARATRFLPDGVDFVVGVDRPGRCRRRPSCVLEGGRTTGLRLAGHRHRHHPAPRPDARHAGRGVAAQHLRLLHPRGRRGAARGAAPVRRRPAGRAHHRDADQVPGGAAGVHLPGRGLAPRARPARPGRAGLRDAAGRRLHQADRLGPPGRHARRAQDRTSRPTSWSSGSTPSGRCSSPTTSARSPSTCWSPSR